MDDDRTREALDRLADMYLTSANLPPETAPPPPRPKSGPNAALDDHEEAGPELPAPPEATPPEATPAQTTPLQTAPAGQAPEDAPPLPFQTADVGARQPQPHFTDPAQVGPTAPHSTDLAHQLDRPRASIAVTRVEPTIWSEPEGHDGAASAVRGLSIWLMTGGHTYRLRTTADGKRTEPVVSAAP